MNNIPHPNIVKVVAAFLILLFILSLAYFGYQNYQVGSTSWDIFISSILLAVPLALLYFSIYILVKASWQRRSQGHLSDRLSKYIYWTPRIAAILIIIFVGMFSLDVFGGEASVWEQLGGFVIHSLPSIVMAIVLAFAWRRPWIGFACFLLVAIFFLRFLIPNPLENFGHLLLFSGPMAVVAMLFWADWKWRNPVSAA